MHLLQVCEGEPGSSAEHPYYLMEFTHGSIKCCPERAVDKPKDNQLVSGEALNRGPERQGLRRVVSNNRDRKNSDSV